MRQAGRSPKQAPAHRDLLWALLLFVGVALVAVVLTLFGASAAVPSDGGAGRGVQEAAWRHRAEAAEAKSAELSDALRAAKGRPADEASVRLREQLAAAQRSATASAAEARALRDQLEAAKRNATAAVAAEGRALRSEVEHLRMELNAARRPVAPGPGPGGAGDAAAEKKERSEVERLRRDVKDAHDRSTIEQSRLRTDLNATKTKSSAYQERLQQARQKLRAARAELAAARAQANAQGQVAQPSPVLRFFRSWSHQDLWALCVGVLGVLSIVGPSAYLRVFLPVAATAVGAWLASSSAAFFGSNAEGFAFTDAMALLLDGNGSLMDDLVLFGLFALGIVRWAMGVECSLYAIIDDVALADPGDERAALERPLLQEAGAKQHSRPPTESARDEV